MPYTQSCSLLSYRRKVCPVICRWDWLLLAALRSMYAGRKKTMITRNSWVASDLVTLHWRTLELPRRPAILHPNCTPRVVLVGGEMARNDTALFTVAQRRRIPRYTCRPTFVCQRCAEKPQFTTPAFLVMIYTPQSCVAHVGPENIVELTLASINSVEVV